MHKIALSQGFLARFLGPLLKTGLPVIKNVLEPLTKMVLIPLGLTPAASATDAAIHYKMFGSGNAALIIYNEEMNDNMKTTKYLEESVLLTKDVSEANKNEAKEQNGGFLGILLGNLGVILLGNLLTGNDTIRAGESVIITGQDF